MTDLLFWLSGKKSSISGIVGLVVAYLAACGILGKPEVVLILGINIILFGSASYYTGKLYN